MRLLLTLPCLMALAGTAPVAAQTVIHRCVGVHGNPVFTDQPCASLDATPVGAGGRAPDASTMQTPAALCVASPAALRQGVVDAFASQNANRLAGLMLWDGYTQNEVVSAIGDLDRSMQQPLLDIHAGDTDGSTIAPDRAGPAGLRALPPANEGTLVLHTAGDDGSGRPRELRFEMVRRAGCLWLRSND